MPEELARQLALIVVTGEDHGDGRTIVDVVRRALQGGARAVQLRAKDQSARATVELGRQLRLETRAFGALLFVNDRVDVAMATGADGAHVGDDDLPLAAARTITPAGFLLGRSVGTPEEAVRAEREGADYLGVGPVYGTPSKLDAGEAIGIDGIRAVRGSTRIPLVAIGGIDARNAEEVAAAGADGVAVIRAVMQAPEPARAAGELMAQVARGRARR